MGIVNKSLLIPSNQYNIEVLSEFFYGINLENRPTGSTAYRCDTADSDIDIVVTNIEMDAVLPTWTARPWYYPDRSRRTICVYIQNPMIFNNKPINFIICFENFSFIEWTQATQMLKQMDCDPTGGNDCV